MRTAKLFVLVGALLNVRSAVAQTGGADNGGASQAGTLGASSDREAARAAFERGLSLALESRYADAKAAFLEAYQAYPHYLVLYNVAQADAQLGNLESAISYLERFLREGADALSSERRKLASEQMAALRRRLAAGGGPGEHETGKHAALGTEPQESGSSSLAPQPSPVVQPPLPELSASARLPPPNIAPITRESATGVAALSVPPMVAPAQPTPAPSEDRTWGLLLGASGVALLGVASGLYLWNDSRHAHWKQARQALDELPDRDQALASDLSVWQQARTNNELLESIERVDVVTIVAASVGALALGAGTWDLLSRRAPTPTIVASGAVLNWRSAW